MSLRVLQTPLWVFIAVVFGFSGPAAAEMVSPASREQIFAHIDSLHVSRQVAAAEAYIEPRLADARAAADSALIMPLVSKLGRLWVCFGQQKRSEPLLREAVALAAALEDSLSLCDALRWLGVSVEQQGRSGEAAAIYKQQLVISRARGDRRHEAWALVGLAYRASLEGRHDDAIADYRSAAEIFRDLDDKSAAVWTLNGLGTALQERGRFREAATCYDQVAELAKQIGYTEVEALAYNNRGSLEFAMGDLGLAMEHFQIAARLQRELKQNQEAVVSGTNVALCLTYMGRLDEAAVLLQDLVRECKENNWAERELYVLRSLADVRRLQGRRHEALTLMRHALARDDIDPGIRTRSECIISLSATLAEMDSSAAALEVLQKEEGRQKGELQGAILIEFELALGDRLLETGQPEAALEKYRFAIGATDEMGVQLYKVVALAMAAALPA